MSSGQNTGGSRVDRYQPNLPRWGQRILRLPDDVAFGEEIDVTIVRSGDMLTIYPKRVSMAEMLAKLRASPGADEIDVRDADVIPERPGL